MNNTSTMFSCLVAVFSTFAISAAIFFTFVKPAYAKTDEFADIYLDKTVMFSGIDFHKVIDPKKNVVCYVASKGQDVSVSCVRE